MNENQDKVVKLVEQRIRELYKTNSSHLLFHGWYHINFVYIKSADFSKSLKADMFYVALAALTHDINYIADIDSSPEAGKDIREKLLQDCGINEEIINRVENIIIEAHSSYRNENISLEAKALSDGDTLFKALPITPIIFARLYSIEQKEELFTMAKKIVSEQKKLTQKGIYFYSELAKKYDSWAKCNLCLWENVLELYDHKDLMDLLDNKLLTY